MAKSKSRLGRGLDSLISGGAGKPAAESLTVTGPEQAKKSRDVQAEAPEQTTPSSETSRAGTETAPTKKSLSTEAIEEIAGKLQTPSEIFLEIPVREIIPSPNQPRREIHAEQIKELADSIRSEGLLQPIVVRRTERGYQLIAGERRWLACRSLQMNTIQARVVEASDSSAAVISLIENLQREDLNPVDEASGYASLVRDFDLTQEAVAERVGKSRASIANSLRLLQLDRKTQGFLAKGLISVGHAKVLLGIGRPEQQNILARQVIEKGLSVRETERMVKRLKAGSRPSRVAVTLTEEEINNLRDLEKRLSTLLKTSVRLRHTSKKGRIIIEYYGNDDLRRILDKIGVV